MTDLQRYFDSQGLDELAYDGDPRDLRVGMVIELCYGCEDGSESFLVTVTDLDFVRGGAQLDDNTGNHRSISFYDLTHRMPFRIVSKI